MPYKLIFIVVFISSIGNVSANDFILPDTIYSGTDTVIIGTAQQSKAGAMVITEDGTVFFLGGFLNWEDEKVLGKKIEVTGRCSTEITSEGDLGYDKKEYSQGIIGTKLVFHRYFRWKLIE